MKNNQKSQKKIHFKAIWWTLLIVAILNINLISAWEWDNVKDYDEETKTITITNALGLGDDIVIVFVSSS